MNRKGEFKVKNTHNLITEEIEGAPVFLKGEQIAIATHADKDYIYGYFEHNNDYDVVIEGNPKFLSIE